jgi:phosphatidylserine/phosphatidylglycerophosphate/cardiolipin synthase-like enzyme
MWRDDESWRAVLDALEKKIVENPEIMIFIEKDAFWTRVYNFQKYMSFWRLWWDIFFTMHWQTFIKNPNVRFKYIWTPSVLMFKYSKENNHSKVYIFDEWMTETKTIIWWMNISNDYMIARNDKDPSMWWWHDYMVLINWDIPEAKYMEEFKKNNKYIPRKIREWASILMNIKSHQTKEIIKELDNAKKSIIIEHWYITHPIIIRKLRKLSRKGIKVQIIMPSESDWVYHANMHTIYKFLKPSIIMHKKMNDLEVYLYKGMIHAKVILIDEYTAIIWSANLTNWSFWLLKETNAVFKQKHWITKDLLAQLRHDMSISRRLTLDSIPKFNRWMARLQSIFI